ncbi:hypothetical protein CVT25_007719 [Psilocybe cyanescens]|uniref:Uncharacterized protein n=1 Tax=Psilocybe cyanescens TaxID=93625 RepID=A0A409XPJ2_PSICY|nr:hypothetical protein CVT25_007719 [Psilocybe cyanescens]
MLLDNPNVMAGLAVDGQPFFSHLEHAQWKWRFAGPGYGHSDAYEAGIVGRWAAAVSLCGVGCEAPATPDAIAGDGHEGAAGVLEAILLDFQSCSFDSIHVSRANASAFLAALFIFPSTLAAPYPYIYTSS